MNKNILLNVKILILSLIFPAILFAAQGDLDITFNPAGTPPGTRTTTIGTFAQSNGLALQSDGKIVAIGTVIIGGVTQFAVVRYNITGSLDTSFNSAGPIPGVQTTAIGTNSFANKVVVQSDGKIVVAGRSILGVDSRIAVARYNTDGSLDTTFNSSGLTPGVQITPLGTYSEANSIALQSDGKIVVAGDDNVGGVIKFLVARYNTDGLLDTTFNSLGAVPGISDTTIGTLSFASGMTIQFDGKIVAAGRATIAGVSQMAVVRYNTDGTLDTSFNASGIATLGVASFATSVLIQSDGKIVLGGRRFHIWE